MDEARPKARSTTRSGRICTRTLLAIGGPRSGRRLLTARRDVHVIRLPNAAALLDGHAFRLADRGAAARYRHARLLRLNLADRATAGSRLFDVGAATLYLGAVSLAFARHDLLAGPLAFYDRLAPRYRWL